MQKRNFLEFWKDVSPCQGSETGQRGLDHGVCGSREPTGEFGRVRGHTPDVCVGPSLKERGCWMMGS